jgi:hypothetical protein
MQAFSKPKTGYKTVQDFFKKEFEIPQEWQHLKFSDIVQLKDIYTNPESSSLY